MLEIDGAYHILSCERGNDRAYSLGLLRYIVMSAIQIAGGFIDFQMGFAIANVIDPQTGAQSPLTWSIFKLVCHSYYYWH